MPLIEIIGGPDINLVRTGPRGRPPVVLMHPVGLDLTWWDLQFAEFGRDHDVVAFDMPNHGLSGKLRAPPTFDAMAMVAAGVVAHLGAGPAHLVGLSVGGMIAQAVALARPELVRSLSLVGTLCTFPDAVRGALRERARVSREEGMARIALLSQERWFPPAFRARRPDVLDRAAKSLLLQDPDFHASMWEMIATLDLEALLPTLRCPTLVVAGTEDINAPVAAARRIARLIPGAMLHEMPGAGHFPPMEMPDVFNGLVRDFLAAEAHEAFPLTRKAGA